MGNSNKKDSTLHDGDQVKWENTQFKKIIIKDNNLETTLPIHNKADYDRWVQSQNKNPASTSRYAFNPIKNSYKDGGMCGSGGNATITYDAHPYVLEKEIQNRQKLEYGRFKEDQLWYLLWAISDVGKRFHESGYRVGDITPKNILMNDQGIIKLTHQFSWPDNKINYDKALYEKEFGYLSPEDLKQIAIGRDSPETDLQTSDAFSTGLTVMDAALLTNSKGLYDKKLGFDFEALNGKRVNLANQAGFSNQLKHVILNLTEFQPEDRLNLSELNNWLEPYSDKIENFQSFNSNAFPKKLHQTATSNPISQRILNFEDSGNNNYNNTNIGNSQAINNNKNYNSGNMETNQVLNTAAVGIVDNTNNNRLSDSSLNRAATNLVDGSQRDSYRNIQEEERRSSEKYRSSAAVGQMKSPGYSQHYQSQNYSDPRESQNLNNRPISFGVNNEQSLKMTESRPATITNQVPGGPTSSYRPKSQPKNPQNTSQGFIISTNQVQGGPTNSSRPKSNSKEKYEDHNHGIHPIQAAHQTQPSSVGYSQHYPTNYHYSTSTTSYKTSNIPNFSSNSQYQVSSNLPASPRSPTSNEDFLKMIEDKIKYSRKHFPSE